jgi:hypothetical protein
LIVADRTGAVNDGSHIELTLEDNRVRFEANLTSARQTGLHLSAQLLKLARQVR